MSNAQRNIGQRLKHASGPRARMVHSRSAGYYGCEFSLRLDWVQRLGQFEGERLGMESG